jgi:hypothetical protein
MKKPERFEFAGRRGDKDCHSPRGRIDDGRHGRGSAQLSPMEPVAGYDPRLISEGHDDMEFQEITRSNSLERLDH